MSRELKLNNTVQDVTKLGGSFNVSAGKSGTASRPVDIDLAMRLADDEKEVRGFGQPITPELARDISLEYIKKSARAWTLIMDIQSGKITTIDEVKNAGGFNALLTLLDPKKQIVSGVFGKEAILQMIALKDCEGLRYFIGEMEEKTTVILTGVRDTTPKGCAAKALSEPLAGWEHYRRGSFDATIPPDTEVHKSSLTRDELFTTIHKNNFDESSEESIVKVLFGEY